MVLSFKSFLLAEKDNSFLVAQSGKDSVSLDNRLVLDALNASLAKVTSETFLTPYMAFGSLARILAHASIILPQRVFFELESGETVFKVEHFGKPFGPDLSGHYQGPGDGDGYFIYFAYERNESGWYTCYAEIVDPVDLAELLADDSDDLDEGLNEGDLDEKHIGFAKLKGELSHEKGVKNPGAVAAAIGRKKYGEKKMEAGAKGHHAVHEESDDDTVDETAPPGREDQVKALKSKFGMKSAFKIAWSSYRKSHPK